MKSVSGGREAAKGLNEIEFNSDSNLILDSLARIEETAYSAGKASGLNINAIYEKIGFDPIPYQFDSRNDDWLEENEYQTIKEINALFYFRGAGTKSIIDDNDASLPANSQDGETGKMRRKGIVSGIIDWAGRHPYLSAAFLLGSFAGAVGMSEYHSNKKIANQIDDGLSKAKSYHRMKPPFLQTRFISFNKAFIEPRSILRKRLMQITASKEPSLNERYFAFSIAR